MTETQCFFTIADIKKANKAIGHHWFDDDAMRFFNSQISPEVYAGQYFITSEAFSDDSVRAWTIRKVTLSGDDRGSIDTVGSVGQHPTHQQAKAAVELLKALQ